MNDAPRYVTFRDYLRVARERRVLVICITLLFTAGGLAYSLRQEKVYTSEASIEFKAINSEASVLGERVDSGGETPEQRAAVAASTLLRAPVYKRAVELLKGRVPCTVNAAAEARTNLVVVTARANTGFMAAACANAFAQAAVDVTRDEVRKGFADDADAQRGVRENLGKGQALKISKALINQSIARLEELSHVAEPAEIRRTAAVPHAPIEPRPVRTTLLGLLLGLTLGLVAAFVRDSLDRRFKSSHEITEELHLPLLGYVQEAVLGRTLTSGKDSLSDDELEGFRVLRTNIEFLDVDQPPKVLLVTSSLPQEGKSTISSALAAAYSIAGKRTLLVEGDLRRPTLAGRLGIKSSPGLTDYLVGHATPAEVLQTIAPPATSTNGARPAGVTEPVPFVAIVAGSPAPQPAELLRSKRCMDFLKQVRDAYDVVIVDSCPLLSVVDTLELLPAADAVIVCVRASKTTRDHARAAKAAMSHLPERPTGVVVTGVRPRDDAYNYGYYSYGYVYGAKS